MPRGAQPPRPPRPPRRSARLRARPYLRLAIPLALAGAVGLAAPAGCERSPAPGAPASRAAAQFPTPVLDAWARLETDLPRAPMIALVDVLPLEAPLTVDPAALPGTRESVLTALDELRPVVDRILALSVQKPEPAPRPPFDLVAAGRAVDPWFAMGIARAVLPADASRAFDAGDMAGAAARLAALARIGRHQMGQGDPDLFASGLGQIAIAARKTVAMVDDGLLETLPLEARRDLDSALAAAHPDAGAYISEWESRAHAALAEARAQYGAAEGLPHLREMLSTWGMDGDPEMLAGLGGPEARMIVAAMLVKPTPADLGALSHEDVRRSLDLSETLIPRIGAALRSENLPVAFDPIVRDMMNDRAQITRLVIGAPGAVLMQIRSTGGDVAEARQALGMR